MGLAGHYLTNNRKLNIFVLDLKPKASVFDGASTETGLQVDYSAGHFGTEVFGSCWVLLDTFLVQVFGSWST